MPLPADHIASVGLVFCGDTAIGSGFVALLSNDEDPSETHAYFVTAKHVVEHEVGLSVKIRRRDGSIETEPVSGWVYHQFDAAAVPIPDRTTKQPLAHAIPIESRALRALGGVNGPPLLGAQVLYAGLFDPGKALSKLGVPVVRSGTLAAWGAPIERENEENVFDFLHLIDCRSYEGFSGSPCWTTVSWPGPLAPGETGIPGFTRADLEKNHLGSTYETALLIGMVIEHYDDRAIDGLASKMGIALVLPVDFILDLLRKNPDLIEQRKRDLANRYPAGKPRRQKLSAKSTELEKTREVLGNLMTAGVKEEAKEVHEKHQP